MMVLFGTQNPLRHSGLSAHMQTHAWYLGLLDGVWQQYIVNPPWNYHQKDTFMLQGIVGYNTRLISAVLPKEILAQTKDWDTRLAYLLQLQNGLPV